MSDAERIFLNIFSLFRRDVTEDDYASVFRHVIEETGFNDVFVKMDGLDFTDLVKGLVEWRLISFDEINKLYTTHPLIKGYFEFDFEEKEKKLCHKRIYNYFGKDAPEKPETLEEMQPLFEQVYHGCAAELYDKVINDVYFDKIRRSDEHFITHILGAWEIDISLVRTFFPKGNFSQMSLVTNKIDQNWLLAIAGLALLATGRPKEAEKLLFKKTNMQIKVKDWKNASKGYGLLADLQFCTGELESGLENANKALDTAEKAKSDENIMSSKAYLAWIFHLTGKNEEAEKVFREADELEGKISGNRLHGLWGVFYADFLLSMKRIVEAFELTKQNLEICQRYNVLNDISRCRRCLGAIDRIKGNHKEAENHLQNALEIARKVGVPDLEIEALIESGSLNLDMGKHEDAIRVAREALKICDRTGFKLYEPDAEIVLLCAHATLNDLEQATTFAHSAYGKAITMHYRWPEGNAAHLLGEIYLSKGDKTKAREWIEKSVACRKEISDPNVKESEELLERFMI